MSVIPPLQRPLVQFFRSGPLPCPYLAGQVERKLFTRLSGPLAGQVNSDLCRAGFRRSHDVVYRPVCEGCAACIPVRVPVARFRPGRTMRRVARANADLRVGLEAPAATAELFTLFQDYQANRHAESDMARMSFGDFTDMLEEGAQASRLLCLRDADGRLWGCMLIDMLSDGCSAVYSFFDTGSTRPSLGTQLVLALIEWVRAAGRAHVYLGYYIAGSRKMAYKVRFQPIEGLSSQGWRDLPPVVTG
jgi:leucyl-tRNA---protein transferase